MIRGIEHVAIFSHDTEKLKIWYERVLGFKTVFSNGKGTFFLKAPESGMIELVQTDKLTDVFDDEVSGIRHIALTVDNFDQMVEKIRLEMVSIISEPERQASTVRTFFFRDPDGNVLHFIERLAPY
jgi:catechol 2,3-dioxygenase-like lactoylglutathione lyase family enzyme